MNENIKLTSKTYEVVSRGKSQAAVIKDMRPGDLIRFSTVLESQAGASGGGNFASRILVSNLTQGGSGIRRSPLWSVSLEA